MDGTCWQQFLPPATKLFTGWGVRGGGSLSGGLLLGPQGGVSVQGGLCPGKVSIREPPQLPYGYVRAVRILLECILVCSASTLSSIDYNGKNGIIKRKRNQKLLSTNAITILGGHPPFYLKDSYTYEPL